MRTGDRIRELRGLHGLSLEELAGHTGLTKGYLSKIERSGNPPPFSTLQKIAEVLDVDVNDLLTPDRNRDNARNIDFITGEVGSAPPFKTEGICAFRPLLKSYRNKQMSPFLMTIAHGRTRSFHHDAEEFVYVISGCVELGYDGETHVFEEGSSFYLDSRLPHSFQNSADEDDVLLSVDFNYRRF